MKAVVRHTAKGKTMKRPVLKCCPICGKNIRETDNRGTFYCPECWHEAVYRSEKISVYAITSKGNRVTVKVIKEPMLDSFLEYVNY